MPTVHRLMTPGGFRRWMRGQGLSLSGVAEILDLSRRSVAHYASGERKVPRVLFLACMALASARRKTPAAA